MVIYEIENYYENFDRLVDLFRSLRVHLKMEIQTLSWKILCQKNLTIFIQQLTSFKETTDNAVVAKKRFVKTDFADEIISFINSSLIRFAETDKVKGTPTLKNFTDDLKWIMKNKTHIHFSHIYYCNYKVRESKIKRSVVAPNLFRFDFFFLLKGLRAGFWKTRDISIGGKNPTNINFTNIGNQVIFTDTIKYFQQSLGKVASSLTDG